MIRNNYKQGDFDLFTSARFDDEFQYKMAEMDIFFGLTSNSSNNPYFKQYHDGTKFTSTFIYAIAYSKPILIYRELYETWKQYGYLSKYYDKYGNLGGIIPYSNVNDIIDALKRIAYFQSYYPNICKNMSNFAQFLNQQNIINLKQHLIIN